MNVGIVGTGRLGLPVALAMEYKGHRILAYDINPERMKKVHPYQEKGPTGADNFQWFLENSRIQFAPLPLLVRHADIIFVAVQTPHQPQFEGITPLTEERADFDYSYLKAAVQSIVDMAKELDRHPPLAIISTVLPGTIRREILPIVNDTLPLVYSPSFISMGNVMQDYLNPEFFLVGVHDEEAARCLVEFYQTIASVPLIRTTIENAEMVKVSYNVAISLKILLANTLGEMSHRLGDVDVDTITNSIGHSTRRLISTRYLRAGGGDGGSCHPRDLIAMSWLAREIDMSFNLFDAIMEAREKHAAWLCDLMCQYDLPKVILGTAFKAGSNIETGSAAILCRNILMQSHVVITYDPHTHIIPVRYVRDVEPQSTSSQWEIWMNPHVFLIGCNHPEFASYQFPQGSVVIDPWGYIPDQEGVEVIRVGRK